VLVPSWAKEAGWAYDDTFVPKEQLYSEVENVLERHPGLKVTFAHFYFLSADLPRASALFDRFPNAHFDLTPGVEMLYNLSREPNSAREFFVKYAERIVFGTDSTGDRPLDKARSRAGMVTRWLESDDEFGVDSSADALLGPSDKRVIRGLHLPDDVLARIYAGNFTRRVGPKPKPLNCELAIAECRRMVPEVEQRHGNVKIALECIRRLEITA
jgi:hypothetical protein